MGDCGADGVAVDQGGNDAAVEDVARTCRVIRGRLEDAQGLVASPDAADTQPDRVPRPAPVAEIIRNLVLERVSGARGRYLWGLKDGGCCHRRAPLEIAGLPRCATIPGHRVPGTPPEAYDLCRCGASPANRVLGGNVLRATRQVVKIRSTFGHFSVSAGASIQIG